MDGNFFVIWHSNALNVRTLALQDKISALKEELAELNKRYSQGDAGDTDNGTFRNSLVSRTVLTDIIFEKLYYYN